MVSMWQYQTDPICCCSKIVVKCSKFVVNTVLYFVFFFRLVHLSGVRSGCRVPVQPAQVCAARRGVPHPRVQPGHRLFTGRLLHPVWRRLPPGLVAVRQPRRGIGSPLPDHLPLSQGPRSLQGWFLRLRPLLSSHLCYGPIATGKSRVPMYY